MSDNIFVVTKPAVVTSGKGMRGEDMRIVGRIAAALESLAAARQPLRLTDIARELEAPISSTHGLMQALVKVGLAGVADERRYIAGPRLARLGIRIQSRLSLIEVARPMMVRVSRQIDEDVYLAVYEGGSVYHAERIEGSHPLRLNITLGVHRPLHATASGKLYLASLARPQLEALLGARPLSAFTAHTIVDPNQLMAGVERIRRDGFAMNDEESIEGVVATAAPIYDVDGRLIAAVTSPIPLSRYHGRERLVTDALRAVAAEVSSALGWGGPAT